MFAIPIPTVFGQKTLVYCGDPKFGLVWFFEWFKRNQCAKGQDFEWNLKYGSPSIGKSTKMTAVCVVFTI